MPSITASIVAQNNRIPTAESGSAAVHVTSEELQYSSKGDALRGATRLTIQSVMARPSHLVRDCAGSSLEEAT
jgi:hypothetical protein